MSVRKRAWTTPKGVEKSAWVVDYVDIKGKRRLKTFKLKKEADAFASKADVEVREGTHVADRDTVTVKKAGEFWIATGEGEGLERSTINQRKRHLKFHIEPFIGDTLLSKVDARAFQDTLRAEGRSAAMVKKALGSLGSIFADAIERKLATRNPVRDMRRSRKGKDRRSEKRQKGRLKVGEDIPSRDEVKALVAALSGRWRPLLLTAIFAGLRSSEIRGLRWQDVDLERREIRIHQRADEFGEIGPPKSEAGERTIPIPPIVVNALREWKLAYSRPVIGKNEDGKPIREDARPSHLVFANGSGKVESHANIVNRGLVPAMLAAGVSLRTEEKDKDGKPIFKAKYTGLHSLRHFYASWLINRPADGGLGLPLKVVQERMGHSSITMTADTYGHLFPRGDDADELAAAENALLG
ncbi:tyrosine-type recombinase/integrase [Sinorhizobium meliloti]|nr:tyrosine-type recombinase/integrase [Sinorhizobium meliloti]MDW9847566.1 tyrosine-type recombinase/integrase [Sinorhizobium meliloti]MDX0144051.1 tyrosine-type recombinase/integrase [Sinorhizobium meliloti]MDX0150476.1 tyrosine-type recombinase/integrase [Sinorhizobium meliloti]MDX0169744.1 tyrosine-type recombinase/integrase [Sinorhizobium meliloti]